MNVNAIHQAIKSASVEELEQIRELAQAELEDRRRKRREEAMAEIRRIAGVEHIPVRFDARPRPKRNGNAQPYRGGTQYRHPSQPDLVWNAKGQKPTWLRELEREGGKAVEVAASDDVPPPVRKTG